ncbi:MAG TPA: DUF4416 family protein [Pirellulaceae bacterium]|nr:DUF4416 family protein [Planctomycetales bacterium]HRX81541.1 DUF4416 family protein [Pirellulaceae bacterium]
MGAITEPRPVLLLLGVFSRYDAALDWARQTAEANWGPIALASQVFSFNDTAYYEKTMGTDLKKTFFAFERLIDPPALIDIKHVTNDLEEQYRVDHDHPEARPLNLDPGYVTEAKLVLATTKDRDHRLYLGRGIFAEVTVHFCRGAWLTHPWTYPDYQSAGYHEFLTQCRDYLRGRYKNG